MNVTRGTNRCWQCGRLHERRGSYCRPCHAAYMREWRRDHPPSPDARRRANARSYAHTYLRRGHLERRPCAACGAADAEMHHEDYDRPLEVDWLCRACHMSLHRKRDSRP